MTNQLFEAFQEQGLDPQPMPKMGEMNAACTAGAVSWAAPTALNGTAGGIWMIARKRGRRLSPAARVESVVIEGGRVIGVQVKKGLSRQFYPGRPGCTGCQQIWHARYPATTRASPVSRACSLTPFYVWRPGSQKACNSKISPCRSSSVNEHIILSPYFDHLSFFFNKDWQQASRRHRVDHDQAGG